MKELNFYSVDPGYVTELQAVDPKVPNIHYETHEKFACGVLFEIEGHEYFAPISSFKRQQRTNFIIKNSKGRPVGCIRFSFMFPIPKDLQAIKDFSAEDQKRKRLLIEELAYCNKHARRIKSKALHVYRTATSGENAHMAAVCCDFKALERFVLSRYETGDMTSGDGSDDAVTETVSSEKQGDVRAIENE